MSQLARSDPIWSAIPKLTMPAPPAFCHPTAERFADWTEQLLAHLAPEGRTPTPEACNVAKVLLVDRFLAELEATPLEHQAHAGCSPPCTLSILVAAARRLRDISLRAQPPALTPPPKSPRKPQPQPQPEPQPAGIWFAAVEDTE